MSTEPAIQPRAGLAAGPADSGAYRRHHGRQWPLGARRAASRGPRATSPASRRCARWSNSASTTASATSRCSASRPRTGRGRRTKSASFSGCCAGLLRPTSRSCIRNNVRVRIIGSREGLDDGLRRLIAEVEATTAMQHRPQAAWSPSTTAARPRSPRRCGASPALVAAGKLKAEDITEETIGRALYTAGMPDPDIIIRTSGEQRVSNFLLWQGAYAELVFVEENWPDFDEADLRAGARGLFRPRPPLRRRRGAATVTSPGPSGAPPAAPTSSWADLGPRLISAAVLIAVIATGALFRRLRLCRAGRRVVFAVTYREWEQMVTLKPLAPFGMVLIGLLALAALAYPAVRAARHAGA